MEMISFQIFVFYVSVVFLSAGQPDFTLCSDGWVAFHGSCYFFPHNQLMPYSEATHFCEERGSHLIRIDNEAEKNFVKDYLRELKAEEHWLGINDLKAEGTWVWQDTDLKASVTDWLPGQPGSEAGQEDCAVLAPQYDYRWADLPCSAPREPLCEKMGKDVDLSEVVG